VERVRRLRRVSISIAAFLRKVYLILGLQLGLTAGICALFVSVTSIRDWVQDKYARSGACTRRPPLLSRR